MDLGGRPAVARIEEHMLRRQQTRVMPAGRRHEDTRSKRYVSRPPIDIAHLANGNGRLPEMIEYLWWLGASRSWLLRETGRRQG
jgi:hypothetical protein